MKITIYLKHEKDMATFNNFVKKCEQNNLNWNDLIVEYMEKEARK